MASRLWTEKEYADLRRCSMRTLQRERADGTGCAYVLLGDRQVRYREEDIAEFIEARVRHKKRGPEEEDIQ
jgi:hypothetical protein